MISERQINLINKIASKQTFNYTGELIVGVDTNVDIDYQFRITGHKKMISVGEYYDYLLLDVNIISLNDKLSQLVFGYNDYVTDGVNYSKIFESRMYKFYSDLNRDIQNYLIYFNDSGEEFVRTTIDDLSFDLKESPKLNLENNKKLPIFVSNPKQSILESDMSRMSKIAVRTTVTDIVRKLKDGKSGTFYLPGEDGEEYEFTNLPFKYSVELILKIDNDLDGFQVNGSYSSDDDVIEVMVVYNPKTLRRNFYNIIGELNDIVAHELEHGFQYVTEGKIHQESPTESFEYYTQLDEIKSQKVGFRRVAKLRKLPYNDVVRDWFEDHKDIHGLTDDEMEKVINIIINDK
jgi:hypothetical protein